MSMFLICYSVTEGVENSKVRDAVGTGGGRPLPTSVVRGEIAINQTAHKVFFAPPPVDEQILGEEHRGHHTKAIVHTNRLIQLSHSCVDNWVTRRTGFPCLEVRLVGSPWNLVCFRFEWMVH